MVGACPFPVPQGSQVLLAETARAVQRQGAEVHLVVYGYGSGPDPEDLTVHRCRPMLGQGKTKAGPSLAKPMLDGALAAALRRVIKGESIDVVHGHNYEGLFVAALARKRPIIYHAHNVMSDELPQYFGGVRVLNRVGRLIDRAVPHRADRYVVLHERQAAYLRDLGCPADQIFVVPPPVDASQFETTSEYRSIPAVLYSGNLDRYQNLGFLWRAMRKVREEIPSASLRVVTSDDRRTPEAVKMHIDDFDGLRHALAEDCVFACPRVSWSGYPMKLLNAMAAGKAIVACASGAYPIEHEVTGLVAPDNDVGAFAEALLRLMKDAQLRRMLGENARRRVEDFHSPDRIGGELVAIYRGALES